MIIQPCYRCSSPIYGDGTQSECNRCIAKREAATYTETIRHIGQQYLRGLMTEDEFVERIVFLSDDFHSN